MASSNRGPRPSSSPIPAVAGLLHWAETALGSRGTAIDKLGFQVALHAVDRPSTWR
jgi:hypothetical protein